MKMKLELKHLAPYLPYGLKMTCPWMIKENTLTLVSTDGVTCHFTSDEFDGVMNAPLIELKPILRPLSDLTKEIEHNGEKFVPYDVFDHDTKYDYWGENVLVQYMFENIDTEIVFFPWGIIEKMLEWHFDVFSLIDKDLAVPLT